MKKQILLAKRRILKWLIGTLSVSTALFVFQACYGTPNDLSSHFNIEGYVKSSKTNLPVKGIKVIFPKDSLTTLTDSQGRFDFYFVPNDTGKYLIKFEDIDSTSNGSFNPKDTLVNPGTARKTTIEVTLEEK